jgi:CRISPR-associated exonuclease Cas4
MKRGSVMDEWDYIPLSRLSQAGYCLRRAALLTNEQLWQESSDTAKGKAEHDKVHTARTERRGDEVKLYEYPVFSDALGVSGKCDCIEAVRSEDGCMVPTIEFPVTLYPVEFKHGKVRTEQEYEIQLCAQAMCLEEMYHTSIPEGALFYISSHRRYPVLLDEALREKVRQTIAAIDSIRKTFHTPPADYGPKCGRCSMRELCMPEVQASAADYCKRLERQALEVETL